METPTSEPNQDQSATPEAAQPIPPAVTPEMLAALGVPADQATPESVLAAITACAEKAGSADTLTAQLSTITAERDAATAKLTEIEAAKTMAEVDALLAEYDLPETALPAMRDLALSNRDQATALLGAVPKKTAAKPAAAARPAQADVPPPEPIHDPARQAAPTAAEKAAGGDALIAAIRKEPGTKFPDYTGAREEARRRKPELFA